MATFSEVTTWESDGYYTFDDERFSTFSAKRYLATAKPPAEVHVVGEKVGRYACKRCGIIKVASRGRQRSGYCADCRYSDPRFCT